ncbi:membrane-spanning 4-domains subfamily A member 4A-like isoform X2 [Phascolarctos cinereus]|uniref:Membrane-spanning 4-domains subfamily A member 4A-like isoform X2 n=1 Tax=Phascolarctos cinereus TaxID=38626 RepID=A0A6P5JEB2_PHACI|nr:membrane-spanning 4-domains subfamily A member 4A-like isoform X2 [Phascolarctos cinereus]
MLPSFSQPGPISFPQGPMGTSVQLYKSKAYLQKFLKGEPKVLGFIISGSLSIAAENRTANTLVQSSLAMNAVSSVAAGLGIIFFSFNLSMTDSLHYFCDYESSSDSCFLGMFILMGINVILLILAILELAISLAVSSFGCKATCCSQSSVTLIMSPPPYVPENPGAKASLGEAMLRSTVSDTSALPGSHPDSFI